MIDTHLKSRLQAVEPLLWVWKVERLRRHGVEVVQHDADYQTTYQFTMIASELTN
ncbi:hypothetical protein [Halocynthiibacter namhaensis]|uniref:hypothetical protein n=1 Tax=Halocynthiibacter namhaensis TaxID=1290553 RepID=UPI0012DFFAFF|nr:hypothetical protein [Halocynthiibacter namhaensis]